MDTMQIIGNAISSVFAVLLGIVGFFLVRKFSSDEKNVDKTNERNEKVKEEIVQLKIFMEKMNEHMRHINDDLDDIKSETKEALIMSKNIREVQSDIVVLKKSVEANWRILENIDPSIVGRKRHSPQ